MWLAVRVAAQGRRSTLVGVWRSSAFRPRSIVTRGVLAGLYFCCFLCILVRGYMDMMDDYTFSRGRSYSNVRLRRGEKELTFNIEDVMVRRLLLYYVYRI